MAEYRVNEAGIAHARQLIEARQYVLRSEWGRVQPLALLGKQCGVTPPGWREAAGDYGQEGSRRSVADITGPASLAEVRATKQQAKQAAKEAKTQPASTPQT